MAREGDEWRSPVFDIGSAKPSSNIPAPKKITRKSPRKDLRATFNEREASISGSRDGPSYTSINAGDHDHAQSRNSGGYVPESDLSTNGYQARMSTPADSMSTAVEQDDFEGPHVRKYNVPSSHVGQDSTEMPSSGSKDAHVTSQDSSHQVY